MHIHKPRYLKFRNEQLNASKGQISGLLAAYEPFNI